MKNDKNTNFGFTLIEVMIVVAIIGILAAVAYPSYVEHITRSNRTEGQRELLLIANLMEQHFLDTRTYTNDMTVLGLNADPYITIDGGSHYSIDASVNNATFVLTATAIGTQAIADTACSPLTINQAGQRTPIENCWE